MNSVPLAGVNLLTVPTYHAHPGPFQFADKGMLCFHPESNSYLPVNDAREAIKAIAEQCPRDAEQVLAFYHQRVMLIESADIAEDEKVSLIEDLSWLAEMFSRLHLADKTISLAPAVATPTAYGVNYDRTALRFIDSTTIFYYVTAVANVGDLNKQLYLTSTNRSKYGVEAFLYYLDKDPARLAIVDWATKTWALCLPHEALRDYLKQTDIGGLPHELLYTVNCTRRLEGTNWTNEVLFYNESTKIYDLIYASYYTLKPSDERRYRFWGPIVEIAQPFPYPTKTIGFLNAYILQDQTISQLLTEDVSHRVGTYPPPPQNLLIDEANHSFVAHW